MKFYDPFAPGHDLNAPPEEVVPGIPQWTLTVADLFSLILTFFVMLYSMTGIRHEKWEQISDSLRSSMTQVNDQTAAYDMPATLSVEQTSQPQARNLDYIATIAEKRLEKLKGMEGVIIEREAGRLVLSIDPRTLIERNKNALSTGKAALTELGAFLNNINNAVAIESYAPSAEAWEGTLATASLVAQLLKSTGYSRPIDIYALGAGATADGGAKNRGRVNIVIRENVAKF